MYMIDAARGNKKAVLHALKAQAPINTLELHHSAQLSKHSLHFNMLTTCFNIVDYVVLLL